MILQRKNRINVPDDSARTTAIPDERRISLHGAEMAAGIRRNALERDTEMF